MLNQLTLRNFKCARNLTLPFGALTVLSGLNGSGKSTALQAIALIKQSLADSTEGLRALLLRGHLVQLGLAEDVLSDQAAENFISLCIRTADGETGIKALVEPGSDFLQVVDAPRLLSPQLRELKFGDFQFLQADRLTPRTHYDRGDSVSRSSGFLGAGGEFTPDFLSEVGDRLEVREGRRCPMRVVGMPQGLMERIVATPKLNAQAAGWLQQLSPGVRLETSRLSSTDLVALRYSYASTVVGAGEVRRRPSNVGFGLTYCLPIVVACLAAPVGALVLVENPEAHLHPRGQAAMGALLAKCANDGVQIVVETHSDHVLNGVRLAVKSGSLNADAVRVCHFTRDAVSGDTHIETPQLLSNGELTAWPDGFFDEWEKSLEALLS